MTRDPFKIDGPTCLSFSGGSTSGYMLWRTLQANSREVIARWLIVAFANTGREAEETLRFVRDCAKHWRVQVVWLEYMRLNDGHNFRVVDFASAARDGEPFEQLIRSRQFLPNPVSRFCTVELKIRTMHRYLKSLGWHEAADGWDQMVGIRADEQRRVAKIRARGGSTETVKETMLIPLADAGVTWQEVDAFWERQPFKLQLARHNGRTLAGNCDYCFLKPPAQRLSLASAEPTPRPRLTWWVRMESSGIGDGRGARFTKDGPSYAQIAAYADDQEDMFDPNEEAIACFCGD